ncbi:preprotein translocase subunit SecG [Jannaschia rubra]|uniref:Protein-export membrane protein SecG n=1 Tax=Jannaschia rubra TaxID=282197 RepID=A0A0M6XN77_9RHOB|nr:preprotein translocase subunit SecG [Jannaschia rubra]CTQ31651.1 Preprotein translocase band 1 subunit [Jannaschia rubra]SFF75666.1 protein translocase subunit secG [Jannaschia rubra]
MENVILVIHLILAFCLIGIVLLQRSEGGGMGLGGGGGGAMTGRQSATAMTKLTWAFAVAFLVTSVTLTIVAAQNASGGSVVDLTVPVEDVEPLVPAAPTGLDLLPPTTGDAPLTPPRAD